MQQSYRASRAVRWEATRNGKKRGLFLALARLDKAKHSVDSPPPELRRDPSVKYAFSKIGERRFLANLNRMRKLLDDKGPYRDVAEWAREDLAGGWRPVRREITVRPIWKDDIQIAYRD